MEVLITFLSSYLSRVKITTSLVCVCGIPGDDFPYSSVNHNLFQQCLEQDVVWDNVKLGMLVLE